MSSTGSPTADRTITMVTRPACGTPAAPIDAAVAVMLQHNVLVHVTDVHNENIILKHTMHTSISRVSVNDKKSDKLSATLYWKLHELYQ